MERGEREIPNFKASHIFHGVEKKWKIGSHNNNNKYK